MGLFAICISSPAKSLMLSFAHVLIGWLVTLLLSFGSCLYNLGTSFVSYGVHKHFPPASLFVFSSSSQGLLKIQHFSF